MHYYGTCNSWIKQNPTRSITKLQIVMLLSQTCSVKNGVSGFQACGQTKRQLSCSSSDLSPDDLFSEDLHSKKDINSLSQQLCPTPRILQKKSSSRCQKATILTSPEHIKKLKRRKTLTLQNRRRER
ncbi:hypothetical protein PR048_003280 [Dryococelus australis]|uniref:Uncharacterized protein n=1 Tax=Dryococelus australis TaxID=614101 RepID=A0ABQ9IPR3_9NEOP|nr:hypothetical protein PR048_003280 [Dryococelus australis]